MSVSGRRERERRARREAILDAAEALMSERGLWGTTMGDVATRAELSKGAVYLYFETRDDLCAAIAARAMWSLRRDLPQVMEAADDGWHALAAAFEGYAGFFRERPHLFRMALSWMLSGVQGDTESDSFKEYRGCTGALLDLVVSTIRRGQADGSIREDADPVPTALEMWAGFLGVMLMELNRDDLARRLPVPVDTSQLVSRYVQRTLNTLASHSGEAHTP